MREIRRTGQFKRDVKRMQKRGKDMGLLRDIVVQIAEGKTLDARLYDHPLLGGYSGARECHIEPRTTSPRECLVVLRRDRGEALIPFRAL